MTSNIFSDLFSSWVFETNSEICPHAPKNFSIFLRNLQTDRALAQPSQHDSSERQQRRERSGKIFWVQRWSCHAKKCSLSGVFRVVISTMCSLELEWSK